MTVVLALLAALAYGVSDFAGGLASRTKPATTVLLTAYPVGAVLMTALLPLFPGHVDARVVLFGVAGGFAGMLGVISFYRALGRAPMNVVSPVAAVLSAVVPVAVGVATGDRPAATAWAGVALGLLAVALVSRTSEDHPHGRVAPATVGLALLAGLGFGFYFVFLARAGDHSGLWPLVISRLTSAVAIVPFAMRLRVFEAVRGRLFALAVVAGALDASANLFFLLSARHGLLALAGVITSLYPAATVVLATVVLRERTVWVQRVGLVVAAASVVLVAL